MSQQLVSFNVFSGLYPVGPKCWVQSPRDINTIWDSCSNRDQHAQRFNLLGLLDSATYLSEKAECKGISCRRHARSRWGRGQPEAYALGCGSWICAKRTTAVQTEMKSRNADCTQPPRSQGNPVKRSLQMGHFWEWKRTLFMIKPRPEVWRGAVLASQVDGPRLGEDFPILSSGLLSFI